MEGLNSIARLELMPIAWQSILRLDPVLAAY
jgi:hypothetical protein